MGFRLGNGFVGTSKIETSTLNQEIVQQYKPNNWTMFSFYRMSFRNLQSCTVRINNGNPIYLEAEQGFESTDVDCVITSFMIVESGIQYQLVAGY